MEAGTLRCTTYSSIILHRSVSQRDRTANPPSVEPRERDQTPRQQVADIYRSESRRVLATLIRLLGDFDLAEDALQEAFTIALEKWPDDGVPDNPRAWLVSTGRFKAIDRIRRRGRFDEMLEELAAPLDSRTRRRPPSRPSTPQRRASRRQTGRRSSRSTTCWRARLPHQLST